MPADIYTASDLERRRTDVLASARSGRAVIRDTDGSSLALLPSHHLEVLEEVARWHEALNTVVIALQVPREERSRSSYGELTWLRHLDDDDVSEFISEMRDVVAATYHDEDLAELRRTVHEWKVTATELSDPDRREVLLGQSGADDFVEVGRPG